MYSMYIKNWLVHIAGGRNAILRIEHLIHDERFWVIAGMAAILMLLVFAMWVGISNGNFTLIYPRYIPYGL
ncbi:MAG: hypothetical protein NTW55_07275 [Planctomycetota bacterium]|nr:hypothetical protein [Planctomycetota bacterium]